ncbi:transmembrane protein 53-like [Asparagus officinalis]|uniref:transmembrane protein 53-like n=1 Tax=Asparagus officinalis TaxID=4686 RepID=UPI00098E425B|nr:transmembrane protein 53-like [Asparagus officinalis]
MRGGCEKWRGSCAWIEEGERGEKERHLIFHTFSNTGWLVYGVLLQNFKTRNGIIEKIKGCVIDSAPSAKISPQVWAAGYCVALLKKRSPSLAEPVKGRKLDGRSSKLYSQDVIPRIIETIILKVLEIFFSMVLMLPYANQRLSRIISTLKDQPPCPQLYLYSTADKVIPACGVECFIKEQKALGRNVHAHNFGPSPHVDHFRSFPHIYSAKVNEFLKHCGSPIVPKHNLLLDCMP